MKRTANDIIVFFTIILLASCSSKPPLELIDSKVSIVKDKKLVGSIGITYGEKKGEELIPTTLYYEFQMNNTSNRTLGSEDMDKGIKIKIMPRMS